MTPRTPTSPHERRTNHVSALAMTGAFIAGVLGLVFYAVVEGVVFLLCHFRECREVAHQVPWGLILVCVVLLLPETFGRVKAAAIVSRGLELLMLRLTGKGPAQAAIVATTAGGEEQTVASAELPAGVEGSQTVLARPDGEPEG